MHICTLHTTVTTAVCGTMSALLHQQDTDSPLVICVMFIKEVIQKRQFCHHLLVFSRTKKFIMVWINLRVDE